MSSDPDQDEAIQGDKSTMQQQAGTVNDLNQTLNSVNKESIDVGGLVNSSLSFDAPSLSVMSVITSNKYVYAIIVLVFTLALLGFILFGKR